MTKDEIIWEWRRKLAPVVKDVMDRLTAEETRRTINESIRARKRRIKQGIPNK